MSELTFNVKGLDPKTNEAAARYEAERTHTNRKSGSAEINFNRRFIPLSETEKAELRKVYEEVVVNDYSDEYHLSDEERQKRFKHYQAFAKIRRCKRKFHKLEEFVKVYRMCIDCLKVVAEDNGVYSPQKFMKMVLRGEIEVTGLNFPKYVGKDRRDINWQYVSEYISDRTKDPADLAKDATTPVDDVDDDVIRDTVFKDIMNATENKFSEPDEIDLDPSPEYIEEHGIIQYSGKKNLKTLVSIDPYVPKLFKDAIRSFRTKERTAGNLRSFAFDVREDDFDRIAAIDRKRGYKSVSDVPEFTGNIMNREDYKRYMAALEEYELTQIPVNYHGKMRTQEEVNFMELKDSLEKDGWNIRNLYKAKDEEKKLKKAYKRDKKREAELKKKLMRIQDRQEKRGEGVKFNAKKKKKKKRK